VRGIVQLDTAAYWRVLGDELRHARKMRGWTRRNLSERLPSGISVQTLATYELSTRQCSVVRFVEICLALEILPHELLAQVHQRVCGEAPVGRIGIDLREVVRDDQAPLRPLRSWAKGKLTEYRGHQTPEVTLDIAALERMAELCGIETVELIARLRRIRG
jgi:transcriptional regulator with XRE-family HTH domain